MRLHWSFCLLAPSRSRFGLQKSGKFWSKPIFGWNFVYFTLNVLFSMFSDVHRYIWYRWSGWYGVARPSSAGSIVACGRCSFELLSQPKSRFATSLPGCFQLWQDLYQRCSYECNSEFLLLFELLCGVNVKPGSQILFYRVILLGRKTHFWLRFCLFYLICIVLTVFRCS